MPFLTEELWQRLREGRKSIALEAYPGPDSAAEDHEAEPEMDLVQETVSHVRKDRAANKVDGGKALTLAIQAPDKEFTRLGKYRALIEHLANVKLTVEPGTYSWNLDIPVDRARLLKENIELEKVIANSERQLGNEDVIRKMPEKVVETLRTKLAAYQAQLAKNLDALQSE